ncbi:hypothetical protein E1176_17010 [Fulvivirga sp. RKSG066]|uniref:hypothetical protein n=1 Tax=Fulvivirga aurantia TaxID=2529383 RepID=UPI0012BBFB5F|nr:hypothetical protein [Fulvivirga aurantia]MTI22735.1 hypothetical protein [Fulvivirga aurantia]
MKLLLIYSCLLLVGCAQFKKESRSVVIIEEVGQAEPTVEPQKAVELVSFEKDIEPILLSRCQPCHFTGGKMYEKLPFDTAATVHKLGEELFTRIKDEKEQALIKAFIAQKID